MFKNLITAMQFLTIVSVKKEYQEEERSFARSILYFPIVGFLIGFVLINVDKLMLLAALPPTISNVLLIAFSVLITRALHIDGLADTLDGLMGGYDPSSRLSIMKDSRLGTAGGVGIFFVLLLKYSALNNLFENEKGGCAPDRTPPCTVVANAYDLQLHLCTGGGIGQGVRGAAAGERAGQGLRSCHRACSVRGGPARHAFTGVVCLHAVQCPGCDLPGAMVLCQETRGRNGRCHRRGERIERGCRAAAVRHVLERELGGMNTRVYLMRHGEVQNGGAKRYNGHIDIDITGKGFEQMHRLAHLLADKRISAVYSSDLIRTVRGAEIIAASKGLNFTRVRELRERTVGAWEGMTADEIKELFPVEYTAWRSDFLNYRPPQGECLQDVQGRVLPVYRDIVSWHAGQEVAFLLHGGVNRIILADALGLAMTNLFRIDQSFGALNIIDYFEDGIATVRLLNG